MAPDITPAPTRFHACYSEPHALLGIWTSPPTCLPSDAAARAFVDSTTRLAGPDAAARRSWAISPCDGTCPNGGR